MSKAVEDAIQYHLKQGLKILPDGLSKLTPTQDRVLIQLHSRKQKSEIIFVPDVREREKICGATIVLEDEDCHTGTVIATGPGKWVGDDCPSCGHEWKSRRPMSVKPGDEVVFGRMADLGFDDLVEIREDDILAILS